MEAYTSTTLLQREPSSLMRRRLPASAPEGAPGALCCWEQRGGASLALERSCDENVQQPRSLDTENLLRIVPQHTTCTREWWRSTLCTRRRADIPKIPVRNPRSELHGCQSV